MIVLFYLYFIMYLITFSAIRFDEIVLVTGHVSKVARIQIKSIRKVSYSGSIILFATV